MRVTLDGKLSDFEADTARALLAYLVVNAGTPQRRETLAGLLWPEQPEARARTSASGGTISAVRLGQAYPRCARIASQS
jgi:hypothetical protein